MVNLQNDFDIQASSNPAFRSSINMKRAKAPCVDQWARVALGPLQKGLLYQYESLLEYLNLASNGICQAMIESFSLSPKIPSALITRYSDNHRRHTERLARPTNYRQDYEITSVIRRTSGLHSSI